MSTLAAIIEIEEGRLTMVRTYGILALSAAWTLAIGCGDGHDEKGHGEKGHGEKGHAEAGHGASGGAVAVPDHYKDAVAKCEELSSKIGGLIAAGKLSEVHPPAADIKKIAEKLPELAQKDLKPEMLKEVNVKAKELAGTFTEIDGPADAGKKEETVKVHDKIKALIADLKKHAGHDEHKDHK